MISDDTSEKTLSILPGKVISESFPLLTRWPRTGGEQSFSLNIHPRAKQYDEGNSGLGVGSSP